MEYRYSFINDIECFSLIDYFPKNKFSRNKRQIFFQTSFFEEKSSRMINLFKDTGEFYEFFSFLICDSIKNNIKFDLKETIFIPLPSSTKTKYEKRYYNLCCEISKELPLINGYNYINITSDCIEAKNGDRTRVDFEQALKLQVLPQKLKKKNIILFDDILTTGSSIKIVTKFLREFDVKDIKVITLGKTYDSLIRGKFEYYLNTVNNSNDSNKKKFFDFSNKELNPREEILENWSLLCEEEKNSILDELLKLKNEKIDDSFTHALKSYKDCLDCENLVIIKENISLSTLLRYNKETIKDWYGKFYASNINEKLYKKGFLDFSGSHYSVTPLGAYFGLQTQLVNKDSFYPVYSSRGQAFVIENLGWIMEMDGWNEELFHTFEYFTFPKNRKKVNIRKSLKLNSAKREIEKENSFQNETAQVKLQDLSPEKLGDTRPTKKKKDMKSSDQLSILIKKNVEISKSKKEFIFNMSEDKIIVDWPNDGNNIRFISEDGKVHKLVFLQKHYDKVYFSIESIQAKFRANLAEYFKS